MVPPTNIPRIYLSQKVVVGEHYNAHYHHYKFPVFFFCFFFFHLIYYIYDPFVRLSICPGPSFMVSFSVLPITVLIRIFVTVDDNVDLSCQFLVSYLMQSKFQTDVKRSITVGTVSGSSTSLQVLNKQRSKLTNCLSLCGLQVGSHRR